MPPSKIYAPPNEIFDECNWTPVIKKFSDYMQVLCQKLHISTYNQQKISSDWSPTTSSLSGDARTAPWPILT